MHAEREEGMGGCEEGGDDGVWLGCQEALGARGKGVNAD